MSLDGAATMGGSSEAASKGADNGEAAAQAANGSQGGSQQAAQGNGTQAQAQAEADWRASFAAGLDETTAKSWNQYAGRYQSPENFAKSYVELRQNSVIIPKDDKPEAWNEVFNRLGRPEKPDAYKWNHLPDAPPLEEGEVEVRNGFGPVAHKLGMTQKQIDGVVQWHDMQRKVGTDAGVARADSVRAANMQVLKQDWGPDFDRNVKFHDMAVKTYSSPTDYETMRNLRLSDGTFAMDHPAIARMMSKIGAERAEDGRYAQQFNPTGVASARAEIDKIEGEAMAKGLVPSDPRWPHEQLKPLYGRAYGTANLFNGPG